MAEDLYALLGVPKDATPQDIKKAFRTLAKELHPDVTGDDAAKAERFKAIKAAYEVLSDPAERERYDRRNERRGPSPFYGSHWRHAGTPTSGHGGARGPNPMNDLDLEDLVSSFGQPDFGFGQRTARHGHSSTAAPPPRPQAGKDIAVTVSVPADVAAAGGTVTLSYSRLKRADDNRTLYRYDEIFDLKISPGTQHGETLRVERMGDAGVDGGPWGDLVCDLRVVAPAREAEPKAPNGPGRMKMPRSTHPEEGVVRVDVGVVEAILGGRVQVDTPTGAVRVTIPPGTSSGTRLRLRGRGWSGADLFAEVRIVVPTRIDDESRALIERFGELNPTGD